MESQLPNISGQVEIGAYVWWGAGAFYTGSNNYDGGNNGNGGPDKFLFDASRQSAIYKNGVTQVYGDSLAMNCFIKAKKMNINI